MRTKSFTLAMLTLVIVTAPITAQASVKVRDSVNDEARASMDGDWLAWTTARGVTWVRQKGSEPTRVTPNRFTHVGSIKLDEPYGGSLWFDKYLVVGGVGKGQNIKRYDLFTHEVLPAPTGVNTGAFDYSVTASGDYLLFGRDRIHPPFGLAVILYRLSTGASRKIASDQGRTFVRPGQVNGDFAVYARCRGLCSIFRYRISTGTTRRITRRSAASSWPAVLPDGTVYFVKGNNECGQGVKLNRFRNGRVTTIHTFPDWVDIGRLEARMVGGSPTVVFTRIVCRTYAQGIYSIRG